MTRNILGALITLVLVQAACCDEIAEKGRAVYTKYKAAVVTVRVVVAVTDGGDTSNSEGWANGAVLDSSGLTVVALSFLDPTGILDKLDDQAGPQPAVKIASLQMIQEDGTELPAEVVLRDNDLDLAFLRPVEPPKAPLPSVDLGNAAEPKLLDNVVILTQLGEVARRAHSVAIERIETIVEKPRKYYMVGEHRSESVMSAPVFSLEGQFIGIGAMRAITGRGDGDISDSMLVIIVPAADIKDGTTQVPQKGEAPKAEPKQDAAPNP